MTISEPRPYDEVQHNPVSDPPDVRGASQDKAIEAIKGWFLQNFDNPVHGTPYDSAEGGYMYIWGGPYEAHEITEAFFPTRVRKN